MTIIMKYKMEFLCQRAVPPAACTLCQEGRPSTTDPPGSPGMLLGSGTGSDDGCWFACNVTRLTWKVRVAIMA